MLVRARVHVSACVCACVHHSNRFVSCQEYTMQDAYDCVSHSGQVCVVINIPFAYATLHGSVPCAPRRPSSPRHTPYPQHHLDCASYMMERLLSVACCGVCRR